MGGTGSLPIFLKEKDLEVSEELVFLKDLRLGIRLGPNSPVCELTFGIDFLKATGHMRNCTQGYIDQLIGDGWTALQDGFKQTGLPIDEAICATPGCLTGIPRGEANEGVEFCNGCCLAGQLRMADQLARSVDQEDDQDIDIFL